MIDWNRFSPVGIQVGISTDEPFAGRRRWQMGMRLWTHYVQNAHFLYIWKLVSYFSFYNISFRSVAQDTSGLPQHVELSNYLIIVNISNTKVVWNTFKLRNYEISNQFISNWYNFYFQSKKKIFESKYEMSLMCIKHHLSLKLLCRNTWFYTDSY